MTVATLPSRLAILGRREKELPWHRSARTLPFAPRLRDISSWCGKISRFRRLDVQSRRYFIACRAIEVPAGRPRPRRSPCARRLVLGHSLISRARNPRVILGVVVLRDSRSRFTRACRVVKASVSLEAIEAKYTDLSSVRKQACRDERLTIVPARKWPSPSGKARRPESAKTRGRSESRGYGRRFTILSRAMRA